MKSYVPLNAAEIVSRISHELSETLTRTRGQWGLKIHWDDVQPRSPSARFRWCPTVRVTYKAAGSDKVEYRLASNARRSPQKGPLGVWEPSAIFSRLAGIFEAINAREYEKAAEQLRSFADDVIALSRSHG